MAGAVNDEQAAKRREELALNRPADPAGTQPKVRFDDILPLAPVVDAVEIDEDGEELPSSNSVRATGGAADAVSTAPIEQLALAHRGPAPIDRPAKTETPHAPRFQFLLGAIIALGLSGVALTAALLYANRDPLPQRWSSWQPAANGIDPAKQIAQHVGGEYKLPSGRQLVAVEGGPLQVQGLPVTVALLSDPNAQAAVLTGNGLLYQLCGLGSKCAIDEGTPSAQRFLLLRREAMEIALYSFHYVSGIDQVAISLPPVIAASVSAGKKAPTTTTQHSQMLFFRASDLTAELQRPLNSTLSSNTPNLSTIDRASDTPLVRLVTSHDYFSFSLKQSSVDGSVYMLLQPDQTVS